MIKKMKNCIKEKLAVNNNEIWLCVNIGIVTLLIYSAKNINKCSYTAKWKMEAPGVRIGFEIK